MRILGLSSNYHDASAALVVDGQVVAASAEERFTLQKHDPSFPLHAANFCLEQAGLTVDDIDYIAYHEEPAVKFSRTLSSSFARFPFSLPTFIKSMREAITSGFWIKYDICKYLGAAPKKVVFMPHHYSHAAHAFLTSPFEKAAVLTIDAAGEWMCSGIFTGDRARGKNAIEAQSIVPFPHSLGLVYSAFTGFLGFKVNDGECSTMALAAFGTPRFAEHVRKIIKEAEDGTYEIDISYFDFSKSDALPITKKFTDIFGPPRAYRESVPFDCLRDGPQEVSAEHQHYADVAASVQLVLEEHVLRMLKTAVERTGLRQVCIGGGVALNCVAVGKAIESGLADEVFVPPDPGDGGGAMGAALFASVLSDKNGTTPNYFHPYFGKAYGEEAVLDMLPHLEEHSPRAKVLVQKDFSAAVEAAAAALAEGKIVGWVQDRFENGPRALGNRSILASPDRIDTAKRLSKAVKRRAAFRPYACSVADFALDDIFSDKKSAHSSPARWMQTSVQVKPEKRAELRAALHVDGSTRPHVCSESTNPRLYRLLRDFGRKTGRPPVLLNTSFNERGMPMISSPVDALLMFLRTDMDMLVVGDSVLVKDS